MSKALRDYNLARWCTEKFTESRPVVVEGVPDAHKAWLVVNTQSFAISNYFDTNAEADWMCDMLGKALAHVIEDADDESYGLAKRKKGGE